MSIKLNKIICVLEDMAPKNLAESWDNVGLQLGSSNQAVRKVLLTLDVTKNVIREAVDHGVDLIVSHHPFIFEGVKTLSSDTLKGQMIKTLIQNDIAIYVAHTNLDKAEFGLNDYLAKKLGLSQLAALLPEGDTFMERAKDEQALREKLYLGDHGLGKIGQLEKSFSPKEWIGWLKNELELEELYGAGTPPKRIKTVALCSGAGSDLMGISKVKGADVFITGDLKYHEGQRAEELGLWVINAGHFGTEKWVGSVFKEILHEKLKEDCPILIKSRESKGFFKRYE